MPPYKNIYMQDTSTGAIIGEKSIPDLSKRVNIPVPTIKSFLARNKVRKTKPVEGKYIFSHDYEKFNSWASIGKGNDSGFSGR